MASALAPRLGLQAGVGAGGVDEGDDGTAELLRLMHEPLGLAVALGAGHAEVAAAGSPPGCGPSGGRRRSPAWPWNRATPPRMAAVLAAQAVAPLLKEIGKQVRQCNLPCWGGSGWRARATRWAAVSSRAMARPLLLRGASAAGAGCPAARPRGTMASTKPCSSRNSARWKPSGSFSPMVCSMTRGPGKADEGAGLGQDDVPQAWQSWR